MSSLTRRSRVRDRSIAGSIDAVREVSGDRQGNCSRRRQRSFRAV